MEGYIDLKALTMDELLGVVNLYPWFGNARKELCVRMAKLGGGEISLGTLSDAAMYVSSRKAMSEIIRAENRPDCSDKDVESLLGSYLPADAEPLSGAGDAGRRVYVVGGDYFTQKQYDQVKKSGDGIFSAFAAKSKAEMSPEELRQHESMDFYTETLAQIYAEQGYFEQAIHIYSKLILAYPEKNAYFAALIRKLEQGT